MPREGWEAHRPLRGRGSRHLGLALGHAEGRAIPSPACSCASRFRAESRLSLAGDLERPEDGAMDSARLACAALDALPLSLAVLDSRGVVLAVNESWRRFARDNGGSEAAGVGADYLAVCDGAAGRDGDELAARAARGIRDLLAGRAATFSLEYPCHSPERQRWFVATGAVLHAGGAPHVVVVHEDVTTRHLVDDALRESAEKWRTLFRILPVGVSVLDERGEVIESNPALQRILHLTPEELAAGAHRHRLYMRGDGAPLLPQELPSSRAMLEQRPVQDVEMLVETEEGERLHVAVDAAPLPSPHASAVVVVSDVSARVRTREELLRARNALEALNRQLESALARQQALARSDFLTGIANRRLFYEVAVHELALAERHGHRLSVILFDVDRFKEVNDTYGHSVGDQVLEGLARVAQSAVRQTDTLARHGGEEFAVLLPHTDADGAFVVAEHLREIVAATAFESDRGPVHVTVSAGIAEARLPGDTIDRIVRRADQAMYAAKAGGRDRAERALVEASDER